MSRSKAVAAAALVGLSMAGTVAAPAQAATGGGCRNTGVIGSCISYRSGYVYSDFYLNAPKDSSRCYAIMKIVVKGSTVTSKRYDFGGTGRYGPVSRNVQTAPNPSGYAKTVVDVYTCSNAKHFTAESPTVYYP